MIPKLSISDAQLRSVVSRMCRDIVISGWRPDCVVGIVRGGCVPATMISHYLNVPMHTVKISLRDGNQDCESNLWLPEMAWGDLRDTDGYPTVAAARQPARILIVDDINDSGATLNWLKQDWQASCYPHSDRWPTIWGNNVRVATVVENSANRSELRVDYVGMTINKAESDVWVEFPWETWWSPDR
jgi:hypoxanthine phosphoribosyltransferase